MTSVLSSLFSRDPKSVFPYEIPAGSFYTFDGTCIGKSFKKVILLIKCLMDLVVCDENSMVSG